FSVQNTNIFSHNGVSYAAAVQSRLRLIYLCRPVEGRLNWTTISHPLANVHNSGISDNLCTYYTIRSGGIKPLADDTDRLLLPHDLPSTPHIDSDHEPRALRG
ncbi:6749_t:CDS:1, partial [Acaulospora colombiana]